MATRTVQADGNTITLHLSREAGAGYCTCTHPCPWKDVTSERSYRRIRSEDGATVCTRVAPPNHLNQFHSIFTDSLQCKSPGRITFAALLHMVLPGAK